MHIAQHSRVNYNGSGCGKAGKAENRGNFVQMEIIYSILPRLCTSKSEINWCSAVLCFR